MKMRAVQVPGPKMPFQIVEREIPEPTNHKVRIKIQACGICHSDSFTIEGLFPNIQYPRVPGHEIVGIIDAVGPNVTHWKKGQRVGVGWSGGYCSECEPCRRGDYINCQNIQTPGIHYDGGYAEYMIAPIEALALIPEELSSTDAAPLMCAGITTYNALRHGGAFPGDTVAILGIGGLGHLGLQFAVKMGFRSVAIARGKEKEILAKKLGAHHYIDSSTQDIAEELNKIGGAKIILATVTDSATMSKVIEGLSIDGKLIVVGIDTKPICVTPLSLIKGRRSILGWPCGSSIDSQDTLSFCALTGVKSMNQIYPLEKAQEAYDLMMSGKAKFRVVLTTGH